MSISIIVQQKGIDMWRLGYYRGITWGMLQSRRACNIKLEGSKSVNWQWTDYRIPKEQLGDRRYPWRNAVDTLVPHGYVWAIVPDPEYAEPPTLLGILFKKNRNNNGRIALFNMEDD